VEQFWYKLHNLVLSDDPPITDLGPSLTLQNPGPQLTYYLNPENKEDKLFSDMITAVDCCNEVPAHRLNTMKHMIP